MRPVSLGAFSIISQDNTKTRMWDSPFSPPAYFCSYLSGEERVKFIHNLYLFLKIGLTKIITSELILENKITAPNLTTGLCGKQSQKAKLGAYTHMRQLYISLLHGLISGCCFFWCQYNVSSYRGLWLMAIIITARDQVCSGKELSMQYRGLLHVFLTDSLFKFLNHGGL